MMSELVTLLSLSLTSYLVGLGRVAGTFAITAATATTPIAVTVTAHGVPSGRVVHGVVTGVTGETEANGLWVLTPTDPNTFTLAGYRADGVKVQSVGVNAYTGGGTISFAFPDYQILLGRRWIAASTAVAPPRIVFVPTFETGWSFDPYGGIGAPGPLDPGPQEVQNATLSPQLETEPTTFEVYCSNAAATPDPDFQDFDKTQELVYALRYVCIAACGSSDRCKVLRASWPSQLPANHPLATGTQSQRGQMWMGVIQFMQPVTAIPLQYAPLDTTLTFDVGTVYGGSTDDTILVV